MKRVIEALVHQPTENGSKHMYTKEARRERMHSPKVTQGHHDRILGIIKVISYIIWDENVEKLDQ